MNIEDCKVGMGVEPKHDIGAIGVSKSEKLVIRKVEKDTNGGCEGYLYFDGKGHVGVSAEHFEPANKFKVGDKVIYRYYHGKICDKVRYCGEDSKGNPIIEYDNGYVTDNVDYSELSPLKKPDELEVGDKFKDYSGDTVTILAKENNAVNVTYYFGRTDSENIDVWNEYDVKEIIYD